MGMKREFCECGNRLVLDVEKRNGLCSECLEERKPTVVKIAMLRNDYYGF